MGPYTSKARGQHGAVPEKHAVELSELLRRHRLTSKVTTLSFSFPRDWCHLTSLHKPCSAILSAGLESHSSLSALCGKPPSNNNKKKKLWRSDKTSASIPVHPSFLWLGRTVGDKSPPMSQVSIPPFVFSQGFVQKVFNSFLLPNPIFLLLFFFALISSNKNNEFLGPTRM